jgi:hypothetical protein
MELYYIVVLYYIEGYIWKYRFWWTCGSLLASRRRYFNKILVFGLEVVLQKHNSFVLGTAGATQKTFYFLPFLGSSFIIFKDPKHSS